MKTIGIIVAMAKEFEQLEKLLNHTETVETPLNKLCTGQLGDKRIVLMQSGIGKVNATIGAVELIKSFHPDLILSSGCAGGTGALMNLTDVAVAESTAYHDVYCGPENLSGQVQGMPEVFHADKHALETIQKLDMPVTLHVGTIVSGDWFVDTVDKMKDIFSQHPEAIAVDMESAAIAQTCHVYDVPFMSLRVVSDLPLQEERSQQYAGFWDKVTSNSFLVVKTLIESL